MKPFLIIVDSRNSALDLVARQRRELIPSNICYASDFKSASGFLNYLLDCDETRILFAWRGALREALTIPGSSKKYRQLLKIKTVHMLVPDLLGTTPEFLTSEKLLVNFTHGYWVTSYELMDIYTKLFPTRIPLGVLHDLPNISLIMKIRALNLRRDGIIWVGNSRWGSNYGFVDHKGFLEVVKPLIKEFSPIYPFTIIDSSVNRTPNDLVLGKIAESEILIQASVHEGTGLPLLEAIGVGTIPITSDVGIAREVLTSDLEQLIVERKEESFEFMIRQVRDSTSDLSSLCMSAFDAFIKRIVGEKITWERRETHLTPIEWHLGNAFKIRLIWIYRYFRSKKDY